MRPFKFIAGFAVVLILILGLAAFALYRWLQKPPMIAGREDIERAQGVAVELERPVRRDFADYLLCDATVDAKVRSLLGAQVDETIEAVHVEVGDSVELGQLLVQFRKSDLEAEVEARRAAYQEAKNNYERYQELLDQKVISKTALEARLTAMQGAAAALQLAESRAGFAEVRAPIGDPPGENEGRVRVEARYVEPGEHKGAKDMLLMLVDLSQMEVHAMVPETGLALCVPGTEAEFRLEGQQRWRSGTVARVSPSTESANRFFDVSLEAGNERQGGRWVMNVGMYAEVRFVSARADDALAVRASAIRREGASRYVFVLREGPEESADPPGDGEGDKADRLASLRTRLRRMLGMEKAKQTDGGDAKPQDVWKAHKVEVQTGLTSEGYTQLIGDAVGEDDRLVANPRDEMRDGVKVNIVGGAEDEDAGGGEEES